MAKPPRAMAVFPARLGIVGRGILSALALALIFPACSEGVTLNPGDILVTTRGFGVFREALIRVDPATGDQEIVSIDQSFNAVTDVVVTPDSAIFVLSVYSSGGGAGDIVQVNPTSGGQSVIASGGYFTAPVGLGIDASGHFVVGDFGTGTSSTKVFRVARPGGSQSIVVSAGTIASPVDVAAALDGDLLVVGTGTPADSGGIYVVDHTTGNTTKAVSTYAPRAIAVSASGAVYVAYASEIQEFNTSSHSLTPIWTADTYVDISHIAVDGSGQILVADAVGQRVLRVDPSDGSSTTVSEGDNLLYPTAIAVWPDAPVESAPTTWGALKARYR